MPIEISAKIRVLDQEEFHTIEHRIMGIVFEVHNEFGRFLDELLFKREIVARCEAAGITPAEREVRVWVTHESFRKHYSVDMLFCHGLVLEAKAAEAFAPTHRTQALNYLLLLGLQHGTLINLRPERVQHQFISTQLTSERRHQFSIVDKGWCPMNERVAWLKQKMAELLEDWGAFLEISLYREAIAHFLGGGIKVVSPIPIYSGERLLGHQNVHLLTPETAFTVTAVTGDRTRLEDHQRRFLRHTPLQALQWINLNHHEIEFSTLTKG